MFQVIILRCLNLSQQFAYLNYENESIFCAYTPDFHLYYHLPTCLQSGN